MSQRLFLQDHWRALGDSDSIGVNLWGSYAEYIRKKLGWGIRATDAIGCWGDDIFEQEFALRGDDAYRDSVILGVRNIWFLGAFSARRRRTFARYREMIQEPVLDFGCGSGFQLCLLQEWWDLEDLWGLELASHQSDLFRDFLHDRGIHSINDFSQGPPKYGTIICTNVLEHLKNPMKTVHDLESRCTYLLANISIGPKEQHIVPLKEMLEVESYLKSKGWLLEAK